MELQNKIQANKVADVRYLPRAFVEKAEQLLIEVRSMDQKRNKIGLAELSFYHQELDWTIKNFPHNIHHGHILPELKSRRLACVIRIEFMQSSSMN